MSGVAEIQQAIAKLSPEEHCELMAVLLPPLEDDAWDLQMKEDAASGKLDFIDANIAKAQRDGTLIPLSRILEEAKA